jgi:hypothetical protein
MAERSSAEGVSLKVKIVCPFLISRKHFPHFIFRSPFYFLKLLAFNSSSDNYLFNKKQGIVKSSVLLSRQQNL